MENVQLSEQELGDWVREQFQLANKHLAQNGVVATTVVADESRYMAPNVAVWKIKASDGRFFWVIGGKVPADYILIDNAKTARDAIRYFSMRWQLQAENIGHLNNLDDTQKRFAQTLVSGAEDLYELSVNENLWQ